jgi:hypothetical protein
MIPLFNHVFQAAWYSNRLQPLFPGDSGLPGRMSPVPQVKVSIGGITTAFSMPNSTECSAMLLQPAKARCPRPGPESRFGEDIGCLAQECQAIAIS